MNKQTVCALSGHDTYVERDWLDRTVAVCADCGTVTEVYENGAWRSTLVEFDEKGFVIGGDYEHDLLSHDSLAVPA